MQRVLAFAAAVLAAAASATAQPVRSLPVNASDLVYSPLTGRLYASVTATNNILVIDPVAGVVTGELFGPGLPVFDQPNKLAISEAGDVLYIGVDGVPGVLRLTFEGFGVSAGAPFQLGTPDPIFGVRAVEDLAVLPGNANAFAVARQFPNVGPGHAGVAVYDTGVFASGVERSNVTAIHTGSNVIAFGATAGRLYGYNNETTEFGFRRMDVTASGVTVLESTDRPDRGAQRRHRVLRRPDLRDHRPCHRSRGANHRDHAPGAGPVRQPRRADRQRHLLPDPDRRRLAAQELRSGRPWPGSSTAWSPG